MITTTTPALEVWNGTGRRIKKETKKAETNLPAAVTMTPRCLRVAVHVFFWVCSLVYFIYCNVVLYLLSWNVKASYPSWPGLVGSPLPGAEYW